MIKLYFAVIICLLLGVLKQAEATVILTAPSSPPCFGLDETYKLTCTHPVLDADIRLEWERNGTRFSTSASTTHQSVETSTTTTTLTITVTREEFENTVYTYRCFTYDGNEGFNDPNRVISNEVFVDPPEKPINTSDWIGSKSIFCNWTRVEQVCFQGTTYRCKCTRVSDNEVIIVTDNTTNETEFMFTGLEPNTTYRVEIFLNGTNSSTSSKMYWTTFERVNVTRVSFDNNTANLTCKYNNSVNNTIYSVPPQISWKRNGINVTGNVTIFNTEPLQTVNMAVDVGDNVSCSIHLIKGGVEESDPIEIQYSITVISSESANTGLIIGIVVGCVAAVVPLMTVIAVLIIVCYKKSYQKNQKCQPESDSETKDARGLERHQTSGNLDDTKPATDKLHYADLTFTGHEPVHSDNEMYKVEYATTHQA